MSSAPSASTPSAALVELFEAERKVRALRRALLDGAKAPLVEAAAVETARALATGEEDEDAGVRLAAVAALLGDLDGDRVVDLLVDMLGGAHVDARVAAGEALEGLAFDRWKEVATGIERAVGRLEKGNLALQELPYLLAQVGEPGCAKLLERFCALDDADAVASAIEALAELGDPAGLAALKRLEGDRRTVVLDDGDASESVTLGELAREAKELLGEVARGGKGPGRGA